MVLPFQEPAKSYRVLPPPVDAPDLGSARTRISVEGDVLTVLCRSAAPQVWMTGGPGGPMRRIGSTDVWALRFEMPGWDRAFFDYGFSTNERWAFFDRSWRGPHAPAPPAKASRLRGRMVETNRFSPALGERRRVWVYRPPHPPRGLPAFFITDGSDCERFARVLEPLILAHRVRPCAIVGTDNGGYRAPLTAPYDESKWIRPKEYVPGLDPIRFARHRRFFAEEVPAWTAKAFGLSRRPEDRAAMGYSDGAQFVLALAADRPQAFRTVVPMSPAAPSTRPYPAHGPRLLLSAGRLESPIDRWTANLHARVPGSILETFVAGHQLVQWELAFSRFAPRVFPFPPRSRKPLALDERSWRSRAGSSSPSHPAAGGFSRRKPLTTIRGRVD